MKLKYYLSLILLYGYGTTFAITPNSKGVYEIGNATQLEEFAALVNSGNVNANAELTANINMRGIKHTPIGNSKERAYTGTFNGKFHTIASLVMNEPSGSNLALFGYIGAGAKLCNTVIDEYSEFLGENNCASFVGEAVSSQAGYATFECIGSGAKVHAYSSDSNKGRASGLVGPSDGKVKYKFINCYNTGEVRGVKVGGLSVNAPTALCQSCFVVTNVKVQATATASAKNPTPVGQIFIAGVETFDGEWTYNFFFGGSENKGTFYPKIYNSGQAWNQAAWGNPASGHPNGAYKVYQSEWAPSGALCYFLNNKSTDNPIWGQNLDKNEAFPTFVPGKKVVDGNPSTFSFNNTSEVTKHGDTPGEDVPAGGVNIKGKVTCGGNPVAGVQISDGINITFTDAKGEYSLVSDKECGYVFFCNPKGYLPKISEKDPIFYKNLRKPVNKSTLEIIDFELVKENTDNHSIVFLADIQMSNTSNDVNQYIEFTVPDINKTISDLSVDGRKVFGITLGDQSYDKYWHLGNGIPEIKNLLNKINPEAWWQCMGNHDNDPNIAGDWAASATYRNSWGPTYYSFNLGEVHYVVLDNIEYLNPEANRNDRSYNVDIVNQVLKWFRKDLENVSKDTPLVVCMHAPYLKRPQCSSPDVVAAPAYRYDWGSKFASSIQGFKNVRVFTGHAHTNYVVIKDNVIEYNVGSGSGNLWHTGDNVHGNIICTDGSVGGYRVMNVDGTKMSTYYKSTGFDKWYQFRAYDLNHCHIVSDVYCPDRDGAALEQFLADGKYGYNDADYYADGTAKVPNRVLINVFGYDTRWKVEAFENNETLKVQRVSSYDPLFIISDAVKRYEIKGTLSGEPTKNSHMFIAQAKTATAPVTIKVTDEDGGVHYQTLERPKQLKIANHMPGAEGSGFDEIVSTGDIANYPVEYFSINGTKVTGDNLTPGLYIRRQGSKTEKIIIK